MEPTDEDTAGRARSRQVRVWRAIVFAFVGTSALVRVGVFFGAGPFSGMRSVFVHEDPVWGTCYTFERVLTETGPCHDVPLSTVGGALGVTFPAGTTVVDSSSTGDQGWGDHHGGSLTATVHIPLGTPSPLSEADEIRLPDVSANSTAAADELQKRGAANLTSFASTSVRTWWAISGTADDGTYIYVSAAVP